MGIKGFGAIYATVTAEIMLYHLPQLFKPELPLERYSGQGLENKINDIAKSIYHNKSNKHDSCCEAIQAMKRIERLQMF